VPKSKLIASADENSRIGLLGGSFNPAHEGHLYITLEAIKRFNLKKVYWLVTPQNPLKEQGQTDNYKQRLASARAQAKDKRIIVSDFESHQSSRYTVDTVATLKSMHPQAQFIWLMGADLLASFHLWKNWQDIVRMVPIAIFERGQVLSRGEESQLFKMFPGGKVITQSFLGDLCGYPWYIVPIKEHTESSTRIRSLYPNGIWYKK
jgi:nicotinate-nucleotide adenylyltransferase